MTAQSTVAIAEIYDDVKLMIYNVSHKFSKRFPGTYEEWLSEANYAFLTAYHSFDHTLGVKFSSWLYTILNSRMMSTARKLSRELKNRQKIIESGKLPYRKCPVHPIESLMMELSDDARFLVGLIIDTPRDIKLHLLEERRRLSFKVRMRAAIREFLEDIGWPSERVEKAWNEVRDAMLP